MTTTEQITITIDSDDFEDCIDVCDDAKVARWRALVRAEYPDLPMEFVDRILAIYKDDPKRCAAEIEEMTPILQGLGPSPQPGVVDSETMRIIKPTDPEYEEVIERLNKEQTPDEDGVVRKQPANQD